jgi:TolA-binding protein
MAISWITALKLVPWGDVIEATPQVVKAAKGLLRKKDGAAAEEAATAAASSRLSTPHSSGEQALQLIQSLEGRIRQLEQGQQQSAELIQQLAEQNAQVIRTVDLLRTGAQRLAWACGVLGITVIGLVIALWRM